MNKEDAEEVRKIVREELVQFAKIVSDSSGQYSIWDHNLEAWLPPNVRDVFGYVADLISEEDLG